MPTRKPTEREKFTLLTDILILAARDAEVKKLSGFASREMKVEAEQCLKDARQQLLTEIGVYP